MWESVGAVVREGEGQVPCGQVAFLSADFQLKPGKESEFDTLFCI